MTVEYVPASDRLSPNATTCSLMPPGGVELLLLSSPPPHAASSAIAALAVAICAKRTMALRTV